MLKRRMLASVAVLALAAAIPAHATMFDRDVTTVEYLTPTGDSFPAHLARQYRDFSLFESKQMMDWPDADYFAEKAFNAANGDVPGPEKPRFWHIGEAAELNELEAARQNFLATMAKGAADKAPYEAAVAQAKYDCWVEQQEEGWQHNHIAACKRDFELAMAKLDEAMQPPKPVAAVPEEMPAQPMTEVKTEMSKPVPVTQVRKVFFEFDKAELTSRAKTVIRDFVDGIEDKDAVEIVVTGHADRAGPSSYNMRLSERRAEAVRGELVRQGMTISTLKEFDLKAMGESEPAVQTADGVAERSNRRVELFGVGQIDSTRIGQLSN